MTYEDCVPKGSVIYFSIFSFFCSSPKLGEVPIGRRGMFIPHSSFLIELNVLQYVSDEFPEFFSVSDVKTFVWRVYATHSWANAYHVEMWIFFEE